MVRVIDFAGWTLAISGCGTDGDGAGIVFVVRYPSERAVSRKAASPRGQHRLLGLVLRLNPRREPTAQSQSAPIPTETSGQPSWPRTPPKPRPSSHRSTPSHRTVSCRIARNCTQGPGGHRSGWSIRDSPREEEGEAVKAEEVSLPRGTASGSLLRAMSRFRGR